MEQDSLRVPASIVASDCLTQRIHIKLIRKSCLLEQARIARGCRSAHIHCRLFFQLLVHNYK